MTKLDMTALSAISGGNGSSRGGSQIIINNTNTNTNTNGGGGSSSSSSSRKS